MILDDVVEEVGDADQRVAGIAHVVVGHERRQAAHDHGDPLGLQPWVVPGHAEHLRDDAIRQWPGELFDDVEFAAIVAAAEQFSHDLLDS